MNKKCEANPCFTASARSSKIACWKCEKTYHLKCAGVSGNQHKMLRDCTGAVWLCPTCHNSPSSTDQLPLYMIFDRLSSIVRLIGVQIDATRSLCRAYGQNLPRSSCCYNRSPRNKDQKDVCDFDEAINNMQLEFSKVFNSFVDAADHPTDVNTNKRNRTSSCSSSCLAPRIEKRIRVDASVDTSDLLSCVNAPEHISPGNISTSICPAEARQDSTPLIRESIVQTTTTTSPALVNTTVIQPKESAVNDNPANAVAASVSSQYRNSVSQRMQPNTASAYRTQPASSTSVNAVTRDASSITHQTNEFRPRNSPNNRQAVSNIASTPQLAVNLPYNNTNNTVVPTLPTLSIAPPMTAKSFYITRFLPHETCENIKMFIALKCNCDPSLIQCFKLVRQKRENERPLSFLSFKIYVPEALESSITSSHFWPKGVTISPFLERSSVRLQRNQPTPLQQLPLNIQREHQQHSNQTPVQLEYPINPESVYARALPRRITPLPTQQRRVV